VKTRLLVAALASCFIALAPAGAQEIPFTLTGEVRVEPIGFPARGGGYSSRAERVVYDNLTEVANGSGTHLGTSSMILEDIGFGPGPWEFATGRLITEISYGLAVLDTLPGDEQVLLVFWDWDDVAFQGWTGAGSNMINPGAQPLAVVRINPIACDPFCLSFYTTDLTGLPGGGVAVADGDTGIILQVAWVNHGFTPAQYQDLSGGIFEGCASTTARSTVFVSESLAPVGGNPAIVGSTTAAHGRDISSAAMCVNIGRLIGNGAPPAGSGNIEHRFINASPQRGYMVRLKGLASCGSADFNCDGSVGDDGDIEAFFACLGGGCPPSVCGSTADFDEDGDTGTDADIEAFFRVVGGGGC